MIDSKALDLYDAAYLAGGSDRVVDTALAVLLESGRVRAQRTGELSVVEPVRGNEVEAAVLDALGTRGRRTAGMVRMRAGKDKRITRIADRLVTAGLLSTRAPARRFGLGRRRSVAPTQAGRRALRDLRAESPTRGVTAGSAAGRVAIRGTGQLRDAELRAAVFGPPPGPVRTPRRKREHYYAGGRPSSGGAGYYGASGYYGGAAGLGSACGSGSGSGCGGSQGGGGCGGSGGSGGSGGCGGGGGGGCGGGSG
jgi:DNA-binding MarR family transcriptional regulator